MSTSTFIEIEQIDIVDFVRDIGGPVRILKLDVEGAEVPIIERLIESEVMSNIGVVFAETHERKIPQLAERTSKMRRRVERDFSGRINLDWI